MFVHVPLMIGRHLSALTVSHHTLTQSSGTEQLQLSMVNMESRLHTCG